MRYGGRDDSITFTNKWVRENVYEEVIHALELGSIGTKYDPSDERWNKGTSEEEGGGKRLL